MRACLSMLPRLRMFEPGRKSLSAILLAASAILVMGLGNAAMAGDSIAKATHITQPIDETRLVEVGSVPRLALSKFDQGAVPDSFPMEHMFIQLRRSPEQEAALERVIDAQQDVKSGSYHHWLTADELGERFGPAEADIRTVVEWLNAHGLQVNLVHKNGLTLDVSGTAGAVREAFHTEIHRYLVNGVDHIANSSAPRIPAALSDVIAGAVSLHDFMPKPLLVRPKSAFSFKCTGCPTGFANQEEYDVGPGDLAEIYNVAPLYKAKTPITGKGETVVVLEVTDIQTADVTTFRKYFGLSSYSGKFSIVHPGSGCSDPGTNGAEGEAALDAEWAGAVAPDADVELASCDNSTTNFGAFIAAQNLLDLKKPPPIMSLSYLECEADNGPGNNGNGYVNTLWQQAASEGVSVFVSAGDGSAAGCDDFDSATYAADGIAANGLGSTIYNVSTGGTDFLDTYKKTTSTYWSKTNNATTKTSAKSYVPEMPWDDSCAGAFLYLYEGFKSTLAFCNNAKGANFLNIVGGSGAPSFVYSKPSWQKNTVGNPTDGKRDLPDISLFASNAFWGHAILFCMSDASEGGVPCKYGTPSDALDNSAGGTSFTAPQLASVQALIDQKAGGAQGNPDSIYYSLFRKEFGTPSSPNTANLKACNSSTGKAIASSCLFHDVTAGNNDVPCYGPDNCYDKNSVSDYGVLSTSDTAEDVAYPTHTGWDFATGLGTLNVKNIVDNWPTN